MNAIVMPIAKFRLGHIVSTPNALSKLSQEDILMGIRRHQSGDWGDLPAGNKEANDRALLERTRLWSVYRSSTGVKFWLITEANRRVTTVLMPEDY
jgi:hypothetical protein